MCFVIVTIRSLLWLLLSLLALLMMLSSFMSATWLLGPKIDNKLDNISYTPTVGIYNRCTYMKSQKKTHCGPFAMFGFATDDDIFPAAWKASKFFIALGNIRHLIKYVFLIIIIYIFRSFYYGTYSILCHI